MKKYTCDNKNRSDCLAAGGGVTILINNNICSEEMTLRNKTEAIAANIYMGKNKRCICSIYLSDREPIDILELEKLTQQLPATFLLV